MKASTLLLGLEAEKSGKTRDRDGFLCTQSSLSYFFHYPSSKVLNKEKICFKFQSKIYIVNVHAFKIIWFRQVWIFAQNKMYISTFLILLIQFSKWQIVFEVAFQSQDKVSTTDRQSIHMICKYFVKTYNVINILEK